MIINKLIIDNELYNNRDLGMNIAAGSKSAHLNEQEALQLVCHLIKVFQVPSSDIEVIHFAQGVDRATVLRAAADRLDAGAKYDGKF